MRWVLRQLATIAAWGHAWDCALWDDQGADCTCEGRD